jgi:hypothetical protein
MTKKKSSDQRVCIPGETGTHRDGGKPAMAKYFYWPLLLGAGDVWECNNRPTEAYPEGKYPDDSNGRPNYEGGIQVTKLADSCLRHLFSFLQGVDNDAESGKPHLHHLQCCLSMMAWMVDNKPELDDRPGVQASRYIENWIERLHP